MIGGRGPVAGQAASGTPRAAPGTGRRVLGAWRGAWRGRVLRPETLATVVVLGLILVAAVVLRFLFLDSQPGGLYGDEAAEGLDALKLLHQPGFHADWLVWFPDDGGREALFTYVVAAAFHFFGETTLVLRGVAAAFGVAGVLAIAALAGRWGRGTALVAAAWAAGSLWLVAVSRDGMRNAIVPFFGAVALIAILHWAARPGRLSAPLAGGLTSLAALYTYQPLKLLPVLVVVWLLWLRHANRPRYAELRRTLAPAVAAFVVVAAPMLAVAATEPLNYFGRAAATSFANPDVQSDASLPIHVLRTLGMFGFLGDPNARHDVAALPLLPLPLTAVAGLGMWRLWRDRRDPASSLILLALPVFLVAPLIATEGGSPHALRALGLAAPLGVTIGLGTFELAEQVRGRWGVAQARATAGLAGAVLAAVAATSGWAYLTRPPVERYDAFAYDVVAAAQLARVPGSAIVIYDFAAYDVGFLDYYAMPALLATGSPIADPSAFSQVLALSKEDLVAALGPELGAMARPVAWDPAGKARVWAVSVWASPQSASGP